MGDRRVETSRSGRVCADWKKKNEAQLMETAGYADRTSATWSTFSTGSAPAKSPTAPSRWDSEWPWPANGNYLLPPAAFGGGGIPGRRHRLAGAVGLPLTPLFQSKSHIFTTLRAGESSLGNSRKACFITFPELGLGLRRRHSGNTWFEGPEAPLQLPLELFLAVKRYCSSSVRRSSRDFCSPNLAGSNCTNNVAEPKNGFSISDATIISSLPFRGCRKAFGAAALAAS